MEFFSRMFAEGGIFMFVVLALGLLHGIPVLVQLFVARKADFTPYLWGGLASIFLVGVLGTIAGVYQAFEALAFVAPEQRGSMMARAASIASYPALLAALLCLPGIVFTGIASALTRNLTPRRTGKK